MHVAVITEQLLAPVPGGVGRYSAELAAGVARLAEQGDLVTGWTAWHRDTAAAAVDGVAGPRRLSLPARPLAFGWSHGAGPSPRGADVVHAPSPLFPPARGARLVVSVHDTVPWTHPETLSPHGARWHVAMIERAARSGAAIAVLTQVVGQELLERLPALSADRVHVLGAGVSRDLLSEPGPERTAEVRRRLRLPERYLLTLATLEPRKGLDVAIAALARLGAAAAPLVVAGQQGWGGLDLAEQARHAGLAEGALQVVGRIADEDLGVVLRGATALLAPSRAEGFGLPVAEAMALGTPVICSDAPAMIEVAGDAAVTVPVGDDAQLAAAIEAVLGDDGLRTRLRTAGLSRATRYDWDAVAARAWRVYRGR